MTTLRVDRYRLSVTLLAFHAVLCGACLLPAGAADEPRVTLELRDAPLDAAIRTVLRRSNRSFALRGNAPEMRVTVSLRDATPDEAVRLILKDAARRHRRLATAFREGAYLVEVRDAQSPDAESQGVTMKLVEVPFRQALRLLFHDTGRQYVVDPKVPEVKISLEFAGLSFSQALREIIREARKQAPGLTSGKG